MLRTIQILFGLTAAVCFAQQQEIVRPRAGSTLIEFAVVALDARGNAVTGLKKEEISITENGQAREVAALRFDGDMKRTAPPRSLPKGLFTNRSEYLPAPSRSVIAGVVDTLNAPRGDRAAVRAQAMHFLTAVAPEVRVAVYELGGRLAVLHDFSEDLDPRRTWIAKGGFDVGSNVPGATGITREQLTARTVAALETLADHLAAIPGRRCLIWFGATALDAESHSAAQRLATSGIAVYPVVANGSADPSLQSIADVTGGRVLDANDPAQAAKLAETDLRGTYSAAFWTADAPDNQWHEVAVKVRRRGVKLTVGQGYLSYAAAANPRDWTDEHWTSAISSEVGSTTVRLDAVCEIVTGENGATLNAKLQIPDRDLYFRKVENELRAELEFAVVERARGNEYSVQHLLATVRLADVPDRDLAAEAVQYTGHWKLSQRTSTVRLIARDRITDRYGTLDVPVKDVPRAANDDTGPSPAASTDSAAVPFDDPFLERARVAAVALLETLPNYVVKENTDREVQTRGMLWTVQDRIASEKVYADGRETTRDVQLNGKPVPAKKIEESGTWSTGQFGGMLKGIFAPESAAVFRERRSLVKVAGREARAYDFSVQQSHSQWALTSGDRVYIAAYDGTIWLDPESARVLRFEMKARHLPSDFPLDQAESSTDYGMVRIGAGEYLLPTGSVALACSRTNTAGFGRRGGSGSGRYCGRNVIQYRDYKQFGAETNISFGPGK